MCWIDVARDQCAKEKSNTEEEGSGIASQKVRRNSASSSEAGGCGLERGAT